MYRVDLRRTAQKSLEKLPLPDRSRIIESLLQLEQNPRPRGIEKIRGTELWRIRDGDYRIVFFVDDEQKLVVVVKIGHRKDIYRGI